MPSEFDTRAATWDSDEKRARAESAATCIRRHVPLSRAMRVFEYGCGTGLLSFALRPSVGEMTLADSSEGMLAVARDKIAAAGEQRMRVVRLDLTRDPPPAGPFDLVCALMALHHVTRLEPVFAGFRAMLVPGGWLCIADLDREDGSFHGDGFTGHHGFDRPALHQSLADTGLAVVADEVCFSITRPAQGGSRSYPVFLMVARKAAS